MKNRELPLLMRWKGAYLECACSFFTPCCDRHKKGYCTKEKVIYNPCNDLKECMDHGSYKRKNGALRQVR